MAKIGFLGLGAMGLPMAKRCLAAGHDVTVAVHRNPAPVRELEALGAKVAANAAQAVSGAEAAISILPEDRQVEEALLSPEMKKALGSGSLLIEMSSTAGATVRRVAEEYAPLGVRVLDAPVSGGVEGAAAGTLTIMCGGDEELVDEARPVLEAMGKKIIRVGPVGAGKDVKAVNNLLGAVNVLVAAEGMRLAKKFGLDLDVAYDVITASSGQSFGFDSRFKRMVEERYEGGFKLWLMMKDMRIALKGADGLAMPMSQLALQLYQMSDDADLDLDYAAVAKIFDA